VRDFGQEIYRSFVVLVYGLYAYENVLVCSIGRLFSLYEVLLTFRGFYLITSCVKDALSVPVVLFTCLYGLVRVLNVRTVYPIHFSGHSAQFSQ
jgi:hypothetical protein